MAGIDERNTAYKNGFQVIFMKFMLWISPEIQTKFLDLTLKMAYNCSNPIISEGVKDEFLQLPTEFNEMSGGHNWLDVEQFLISEGVDLSSSSQSSSISAVSVLQPLSVANDGVTFCEFSSSSLSHQPRS